MNCDKLTLKVLDIRVCADTGVHGLQLQGDCDPSRRLVDESHQSLRSRGYIEGEDPGRHRDTCVLEGAGNGGRTASRPLRQNIAGLNREHTHLAQTGDVRVAGMSPSSTSEQPPFQASSGHPPLHSQPWCSSSVW